MKIIFTVSVGLTHSRIYLSIRRTKMLLRADDDDVVAATVPAETDDDDDDTEMHVEQSDADAEGGKSGDRPGRFFTNEAWNEFVLSMHVSVRSNVRAVTLSCGVDDATVTTICDTMTFPILTSRDTHS